MIIFVVSALPRSANCQLNQIESDLSDAIRKNDIVRVAEILEKNPHLVNTDLDATHGGWSPLHCACYSYEDKNPEIVRLLLEKGGNVNTRTKKGETPLHMTVIGKKSNPQIIKILIDRGADINVRDEMGETPMHKAIDSGAPLEIIKLLLANGANVNAENRKGNTPLDSIWINEANTFLLLIKAAEIDPHKKNAVRWLNKAARIGAKEGVELILEKGVDVNGRDEYDSTPLHSAAAGGSKEVLELLLSKGATVRARNDRGCTPLHIAAGKGHLEYVDLLLLKGAEVMARDQDGDTPLHLAVPSSYEVEKQAESITQKTRVVELLITKGANVKAKNYDGQTALSLAKKQSAKRIADFLESKWDATESIQIPLHFIGEWLDLDLSGKVLNKLLITKDKIEWIAPGKETLLYADELSFENEGKRIVFQEKVEDHSLEINGIPLRGRVQGEIDLEGDKVILIWGGAWKAVIPPSPFLDVGKPSYAIEKHTFVRKVGS